MQETWCNVGGAQPHTVTHILRQQLQFIYETKWHEQINGDVTNSHKLRTYCTFKYHFGLENYLKQNIPVNKRKNFSKLRISAHTLAIETGRYTRPKTPVEMRKCQNCTLDVVEDEKHFLLDCELYGAIRSKLFQDITSVYGNFTNMNRDDKFKYIMTLQNNSICQPVINFVHDAFAKRYEY